MVTGIDSFKEWFKGSEEQYAILEERRVTFWWRKMVWIFRLTELIDPTVKIMAPQGVYTDVQEFVQRMQSESIDMKQLGLIGRTKDRILDERKDLYIAQWL